MQMTVLHLDDARSWRGGQQQVLYLHQGLLREGLDSTVVCPPGSALALRLKREDLPCWELPLRGGIAFRSAWRLGLKAHHRGAILHAHSARAHSIALLSSYLGGGFPLVVSRRVDFPVAGSALSYWKYHSPRVSRYLAISSAVERMLINGGVAHKRIRRVPSGVDLERFAGLQPDRAWRESLQLPKGRRLVGSVAAMVPHKDQATLLRAFARMLRMGIDAQLLIFGEGAERSHLEELRSQLSLQNRVLLPGFVKDPLARVACFDLFVLSSSEEGLGTAILDAMALGQAVVATTAGGIPDAVVDRQTGRLLPIGDVEGLAHAMASLLKDPELAARYGEAGRKRVRDHFEIHRTVSLTVAAYREVLGLPLAEPGTPAPY